MIRIRVQGRSLQFDPVEQPGPIPIGRDTDAGLAIDDPHVSARHGQLIHVNGRWCYQDLGSTNGSAVERSGRRSVVAGPAAAPWALEPGDRLLLGSDNDPVAIEVESLDADETAAAVAGVTVLAASRLDSGGQLAERLQAGGRSLAPWLALADALAAAEDEPSACSALERLAPQLCGGIEIEGVVEPTAGAGRYRWRSDAAGAAAGPLPVLDERVTSDALTELAIDGRQRPVLLAPLPVAPARLAFILAQPTSGPAATADRDGLALAAHLLSQRLGQLALVAELRAAQQQLAAKNRYLRERSERQTSDELIGAGSAMRQLHQDIAAVAVSDATVLISGPSGAGKELVARAIHRRSLRHGELLAAVNCGALAEGLLESELFGHRKGAFTGAHRDREGLFEVAHGGSLLLDEIGEMSPALQVKLLRVIETGEVTPVGATRTRRVDVRLICATHRDLQAEVAAGRFREDLFYRIHVFPIRVPPLAERLEDLPALARHLLARLALHNRMPAPALSDEALRALAARPWPGNVRQLANVLQRAMLLAAEGGCIAAEHVGADEEPLARTISGPQGGPLKKRLAELERLLVAQCLERCAHNRTRAAAELGISRQALLAKLKKLGLTG